MLLLPKDLLEKLEYTKVVELLVKECYGEEGREALRQPIFETKIKWIEARLHEVSEMKRALEHNDRLPMGEYEPISEDLKYLEIEDYVLPIEGLQRVGRVLLLSRDIFMFFQGERQTIYPYLFEQVRPFQYEAGLIDAIERVLDERGEIRPDASPQLAKIRSSIGAKQKELDKQFRFLANEYRNRGWLTDNVESFRNGRRVLSVPAEHKRKIRGIIHDESATGKTAFIEPEPIIEINNDIFDLHTDERREIYRILKELCTTLRPFGEQIQNYAALVVLFDAIQAKARLAIQMRGNMPKVLDRSHFHIQMGLHPLLYLKNRQLGRETVPFDLTLKGNNRILILSGPNAGGKSITMKSVGLFQLMLQAGLLLPMDETSEMGIFHEICADIGDQQSLEDDLSTYSSRLQNMRNFLEHAGPRTLVVIDEFGSGTDPQIGGAIAEAILYELNELKSFGIITTHYSNLKIFGFKTEGILNGSMLFDKEQLAPTYQLRVGRPGSSYAYEIAQKSGLSKKVLNYARKKTGKNEKAVDELLIDLQREKQELEEELAKNKEREKQLEKLIRNYEQLHTDLEFKRKRLRLDEKELELSKAAKENRALDQLIKEIRQEKNLEKAIERVQELKQESIQISEKVEEIRQEIYEEPKFAHAKEKPIRVGDSVRLRTGGATGRVEALQKKQAVVQMGDMRMTIQLRDLLVVKDPLTVPDKRRASAGPDHIEAVAKFENKLDIRGMYMEEALKKVEEFVDKALISNAHQLRILHGKGTGALKNLVRQKLKEYKAVQSVSHPEEEQGGDGVTVIDLG
ncbi:MAG: Smr/MutS family protein [Saprospirales bacterium]|nr:Smr/MutS family protein [Saprospirales bacterium]